MGVPTVLLLDPDRDSRIIYSLFLEHSGFQVVQAADAREGFRLACLERPTVIVAEVYLPPIGDRHVVELLREDERTAEIPLLGLTSVPRGYAGPGRPEESCDRVLVKPCIPSRILDEVRRLLAPPPQLAS